MPSGVAGVWVGGGRPVSAPADLWDGVGPPVQVPVQDAAAADSRVIPGDVDAGYVQPGHVRADAGYVPPGPVDSDAGISDAGISVHPVPPPPPGPRYTAPDRFPDAAFPGPERAAGEGGLAEPADVFGGEVGSGGIYRPGSRRRAHRYKRRRPLLRTAVVLVAALLAVPLGTAGWADTKLNRGVDLDSLAHRPPVGKGTNYLIVGSDSRQGLSDYDKRHLHTGSAGGRRTDSMILLHVGRYGTSMVSLPRDSWVTVPGFRSPKTGKRHAPEGNKLNAAFSIGGPRMLVRTVERNTGVHIDHYAEVGFAGFVNVVNAVGGVRMCVDRRIDDEKSGLHLAKGCHLLHGRSALAFVRQRHQEAEGDIGRSRNQQKFLSALAHRAAKPNTMFNPLKLYPTLNAGLSTVTVDDGTGLRDLTSLMRSLQKAAHGNRKQIKVPVRGMGVPTSKGSAIVWDRAKARKLFAAVQDDRPIPQSTGRAR